MATTTIKKDIYREFVKETYAANIQIGNNATQWSLSGTKSGYTPISYAVRWSYSSDVLGGAENCSMTDGFFSVSGYARATGGSAQTPTFFADVWWMKNL